MRELRLRMGWTLELTATVVGRTDAQAVSDIERSGTPHKLSSWRRALMLLVAGGQPTLLLVPRTSNAGAAAVRLKADCW
ncbi:hypothetical protein [Azohydromonas aeria]|uniref:hypothetical protein n=1 Tax=Azohydromonas aeria TaxID=2590212 RepID=UPI0012FC5418|nr:hypothetical protein [Azohydromonas aeria]